MNYDNWKLSNPIDDGHGYNMVSPCCGDNYEYDEQVSQYECLECNELFDEPKEKYEYDNQQRESWSEMMADEKRDLGL